MTIFDTAGHYLAVVWHVARPYLAATPDVIKAIAAGRAYSARTTVIVTAGLAVFGAWLARGRPRPRPGRKR
jgi:hypothetical protein